MVDEHDGHTPLAQPREAYTVLVKAVVGHHWRAVVVGDADDPQVAVSLGRRLDDILSGNQAVELASIRGADKLGGTQTRTGLYRDIPGT